MIRESPVKDEPMHLTTRGGNDRPGRNQSRVRDRKEKCVIRS